MLDDDEDPDSIVEAEDLGKTSGDEIAAAVTDAIDENPDAVEDYHDGDDGAINFPRRPGHAEDGRERGPRRRERAVAGGVRGIARPRAERAAAFLVQIFRGAVASEASNPTKKKVDAQKTGGSADPGDVNGLLRAELER